MDEIKVGSRVVNDEQGFGRVITIEDKTCTVKLDNGDMIETEPDKWELAFIFDGIIFEIENATIEELKTMLNRVREIRVAEPGKTKKTLEKKAKESLLSKIQGLDEGTLKILRDGGLI